MSDATNISDPYISLAITPDTGLALLVDGLEATEGLGRPFLIVLDVSSEVPKTDLHTILGSNATLT
jgi:uncharacterized protein involved in type VI secretion and phage assembly